jgi:opacity protein-like surface antigen
MRLIVGTLLFVGTAVMLPAALEAQQPGTGGAPAEIDLAVTYTPLRSNLTTGPVFWQQGASAELSATFYRGLGMVASISGNHASNISPSGVDLTMVTTTFGPRYTWSHRLHGGAERRLNVFGQALIGVSFGTDSVFPSASGVQSSANSFALQLGGGVDLALSRHFAVRPVQADWLRTQFPNDTTTVQNNLRLSAGVVFRFH